MRKLDEFVPKSHPLRSIRVTANEALAKMDRLFTGRYEADIKGGRPDVRSEHGRYNLVRIRSLGAVRPAAA